jgi:hypothetical protein
MNILIPYTHDPESPLTYTLRAAQQYIGEAQLYIVGDKPDLQNFIHIPYPSATDTRHKERNIFEKLLQGPAEFITLYDDEILLKPFDPFPKTVPWHIFDWLGRRVDKWGTYQYSVINTKELFGPVCLNYDRHSPMFMQRAYLEIYRRRWPDYGYCVKSLYGNSRLLPHVEVEDCKVRYDGTAWRDWDCVSFNESTWPMYKQQIKSIFDKPSKWEIKPNITNL